MQPSSAFTHCGRRLAAMPSWASVLAFLSPTCSSAVSSRRGTIAFSSRCAAPRRVGSGVGADIEIGHMSCNMLFSVVYPTASSRASH